MYVTHSCQFYIAAPSAPTETEPKSSYEPTDASGKPLFGLKALKASKEECTTTTVTSGE